MTENKKHNKETLKKSQQQQQQSKSIHRNIASYDWLVCKVETS